ncbi:MAG: hypothetical protein OET63_04875 [Desulfobacterales bacterium]|jgi:hypothetical protein|nr:hypothetical protein [Desulfobacterales bacterium]
MRIVKDIIWTWFLPDNERPLNRELWFDHGGKWLIFDRKKKIMELAHKLEPFIDSGDIESAKCWNGDPSAINVYSLDSNRGKVKKILEKLGARKRKVWEYDYAWGKNLKGPIDFIYSWSSKFMTILKSYGIIGAFHLFQEAMKAKKGRC